MRLGINLPSRQADGRAPTIAQLMARSALIERLGFDGIWMGDSLGRRRDPTPDALSWLLAAAAGTQHIEVGTAVIQVPLRHPVELAFRMLSLYGLSGGRFTAGVGAGSTAADFEAVDAEYADRFANLGRALPTLQALFRGEVVGKARLATWSDVPPGPRLLIGTWAGSRWLRIAAQQYDGWIASGLNSGFRVLRDGIARFRDAGGQRAIVGTVNVDLRAPNTALDEEGRFNLVCGPTEAAERLHRLAELGFDDVIITRLEYSEDDLPEADLRAIRALLPRSAPVQVRGSSASRNPSESK